MRKITDNEADSRYDYDDYTQELIVKDAKLAHAYVPIQRYCETYDSLEGLKKGTIFPELYSPYKG